MDRPPGERAGFMPRPPSTVPPPMKPGQGRPAGLYRGPALPKPGPVRPPVEPTGLPAGEGTPPAEGTPPPKVKKSAAKLSQQQKVGKAPVNTFAQLAALFTTPPTAEEPKPAAEEPKAEEPKAE